MKYQGNTDGYAGGYDASMHISDYAIGRQDGHIPLEKSKPVSDDLVKVENKENKKHGRK